jgi:hypothetical protein
LSFTRRTRSMSRCRTSSAVLREIGLAAEALAKAFP